MRRQPIHFFCEGVDTASMNGIPLSERSFELLKKCGVEFVPMGDDFSFGVEWVAIPPALATLYHVYEMGSALMGSEIGRMF